MESSSEAKPPQRASANAESQALERMVTALQKANELMERHLANGQKTVPARALYFILRDAGFGNSQQTQEVRRVAKQQEEAINELHHSYGFRR